MDRPISAFVAYGIVFGAMILLALVAYVRHVRWERDLDREERSRDPGATRA
jgi:hypothetical protein